MDVKPSIISLILRKKIMAFYGRKAINNFPNPSQKINYFPNFLKKINNGNNGKFSKAI